MNVLELPEFVNAPLPPFVTVQICNSRIMATATAEEAKTFAKPYREPMLPKSRDDVEVRFVYRGSHRDSKGAVIQLMSLHPESKAFHSDPQTR